MGYRNYIYSMPKREYNKIKSLTKDEFFDYYRRKGMVEDCEGENPYLSIRDLGTELYELGKQVEFNGKKGSFLPFFKKKDLQESYSDYRAVVVKPEFLEGIIDHYHEKIAAYYNSLAAPFYGLPADSIGRGEPSAFLRSLVTEYNHPNDKHSFDFTKITEAEQTALFKIIEHIRDFRVEWTQLKPYNLHKGDLCVTTSWKWEYAQFELVRIYKSFDWKKNVMFYFGC